MRRPRFRKFLDTIHEPRSITALMIGVYTAVLADVVLIILTPGPTPPLYAVSATMIGVGAAVGLPAAWRGFWGVEEPAALILILGLGIVAVDDLFLVTRDLGIFRIHGHPMILTLALAGMIAQRVIRIHGKSWAPGHGPDTELRRAQESAETERLAVSSLLMDAGGEAEWRGTV